jgi:hypothetical protein
MPDEDVFVETDLLFANVAGLRNALSEAPTAELMPVSLSNASATESLTTVVGLAASLPASLAAQLELVARSMSLGALRVIAADVIETED